MKSASRSKVNELSMFNLGEQVPKHLSEDARNTHLAEMSSDSSCGDSSLGSGLPVFPECLSDTRESLLQLLGGVSEKLSVLFDTVMMPSYQIVVC
jgi:hypothetical protein